MSDPQPEVSFEVRTPEGWGQGVYANGINVWWVETDMTLDFFVNLPPETSIGDDGKTYIVVPQQIVARVKLAPGMVLYTGVQIANALTQYEEHYGKIAQLKDQQPLIPPSLDNEQGSDNA